MSLEAIVARIEADAAAEAEALVAAARKEQEEAVAAAGHELDAEEDRERERRAQRLTEMRERLELNARREAERRVEHARRKLIDEAITGAVRQLYQLPDEEYQELVAAILSGSRLEGTVEVIINSRDESRLDAGFLKRCSNAERTFVLSSERHEQPGGVILVAGPVAENATFSMLARLAHEELAMDMAGLLAGA